MCRKVFYGNKQPEYNPDEGKYDITVCIVDNKNNEWIFEAGGKNIYQTSYNISDGDEITFDISKYKYENREGYEDWLTRPTEGNAFRFELYYRETSQDTYQPEYPIIIKPGEFMLLCETNVYSKEWKHRSMYLYITVTEAEASET